MGLRVLAVLVISSIGIFGTFLNAFIGLIVYAFWSYSDPENLTWGHLPVSNVSYILGLSLVISTFLQKRTLVSRNPRNILIILFWVLCLTSLMNVYEDKFSVLQFNYFSRVILITLIIPVLIDTKQKFRYYLWAIAIFIGSIAAQSGFIGAIKGSAGGGSHGLGGPIGERNYYAAILCATLPIIYFLGNTEYNIKLKFFLRFIFFGVVLALILTYSRAGFLGLIAVFIFIFLKSRHKILLAAVGFLFVTIFFIHFLPQEYRERVGGIFTLERESGQLDLSSSRRIMVWRSSLEMIKQHPLVGVGFYNSEQVMEQYPDPKTGTVQPAKAIHNSFLKVAAEIGLPAFFVYLALFFLTFSSLGRIRKHPIVNQKDKELSDYSSMLEGALICYFVAAFFINASFIDIPWHIAGLSIALDQIADKLISQKNA